MDEALKAKVARVVAEEVELAPYDPAWPAMFRAEEAHLRACLPGDVIGRIEHFGSTAVPGLMAKPVIDMLVETPSLERVRQVIPPILEAQGYDYFWRPTWGDDVGPFYCWFIKRGADGQRTHHIHIIERHFEHWQRLKFRDYLIKHPETSRQYAELKQRLAADHRADRVAYTRAKGEFISGVMERINSAPPAFQ